MRFLELIIIKIYLLLKKNLAVRRKYTNKIVHHHLHCAYVKKKILKTKLHASELHVVYLL